MTNEHGSAEGVTDETWLAHERMLKSWISISTSMITFGFTIYNLRVRRRPGSGRKQRAHYSAHSCADTDEHRSCISRGGGHSEPQAHARLRPATSIAGRHRSGLHVAVRRPHGAHRIVS